MENIFDNVSLVIGDVVTRIRTNSLASINDVLEDKDLSQKDIEDKLFRNDCDCGVAILSFANNFLARGDLGFSKLSSKEIFALFERCICALDWIGSFRCSKLPLSLPLDYTKEQLFYWLLVDLWEHRKDLWLKVVALSTIDGYLYGSEV